MRDWRSWFKAAGIRAIRTVAQTAVATIGAAAILSDVDWGVVASASALAGILSMLTSLSGLPEEDEFIDIEPNIYRSGEEYKDEDI